MSRRGEYTRVGPPPPQGNGFLDRWKNTIAVGTVFVAISFLAWLFLWNKPISDTPYTKAVAVLRGDSTVEGTVYLEQPNGVGPVKVSGTIKNLDPSSQRGFHVHEGGDITNGCLSTGGHYNPYGNTHGGPSDVVRHVGDLGNIHSNGSGVATVALEDNLLTLNGPKSIIGRSIVVHAGTDDLGRGGHPDSPTTGNAGGRSACGIIGLVPT